MYKMIIFHTLVNLPKSSDFVILDIPNSPRDSDLVIFEYEQCKCLK